MSESGYNRTDVHLNYQYRAFGVPGLGLKRGLAEDLVIAPYATTMALMVAPREACEISNDSPPKGAKELMGFTRRWIILLRVCPLAKSSVTIRSFMAHHQGMSLLALAYRAAGPSDATALPVLPVFQSRGFALQERVPKPPPKCSPKSMNWSNRGSLPATAKASCACSPIPTCAAPEVHLLSNGRYHVVVSSAGGGYSRWRDLAVTRWREDATRDCWGTFIYLRDVATGEFWSAAHQPALRATKRTKPSSRRPAPNFASAMPAWRSTPKSASRRKTTSSCGASLSPTIPTRTRVIELTSYAEVVLAPPAADAAHPAFSNLFVQTEFLRRRPAVLCTRRASLRRGKTALAPESHGGPGRRAGRGLL